MAGFSVPGGPAGSGPPLPREVARVVDVSTEAFRQRLGPMAALSPGWVEDYRTELARVAREVLNYASRVINAPPGPQ